MKPPRNSWHLHEYPDNLLKASYLEWKYFNFSAPSLSGIFIYFVADPANMTGIGGGRVVARIYTDKKVFGGVARIPMKEVLPSKKDAAIRMGSVGTVKVAGDNHRIQGKLGKVSWDLKYSPLAPAIKGFSNIGLDMFGLERVSWEIKMPKARVFGMIKIGSRTVRIRSLGYTDADWGNIVPLLDEFSWAQYNDRKASIVIAETRGLGINKKRSGHWAKTYVTLGEKKIIFPESRMHIANVDWSVIPKTRIKVPRAALIRAENKNYSLLLEIHALYSDPLRFRMPFYIPLRPITVEQPAIFTGGLFKKTGNSLKQLYEINGKGFKEYTLRDIEFSKKLGAGVLV
jgi:hypothetical protein